MTRHHQRRHTVFRPPNFIGFHAAANTIRHGRSHTRYRWARSPSITRRGLPRRLAAASSRYRWILPGCRQSACRRVFRRTGCRTVFSSAGKGSASRRCAGSRMDTKRRPSGTRVTRRWRGWAELRFVRRAPARGVRARLRLAQRGSQWPSVAWSRRPDLILSERSNRSERSQSGSLWPSLPPTS
jgi:hypothetical protein